jgi:leucine-rich repeat protein SHOC2
MINFTYATGERLIFININDIIKFPKEKFDEIIDISIVNINDIELIYKILSQLQNLKYLNLSSNFLHNINCNLEFNKLKKLYICNNFLMNIDLNHLIELKSLFLTNNNIIDLNVKKCTNLKKLCISSNNLYNIHNDVYQIKNLDVLYLFHNNIDDISKLHELSNLKILDLSFNKIESIPSHLFENLTKLEYLNLSNNKISLLPENIENCKYLTNLTLNNNEIIQLPKTIGFLKKLNYLDLYNNNLCTLPNSYCLLNLNYWDFKKNEIDNQNIRHIIHTLKCNIKNNFKKTYYIMKYGNFLERFYIKNVKNKNLKTDINHILFCPDFKFYHRFVDIHCLN